MRVFAALKKAFSSKTARHPSCVLTADVMVIALFQIYWKKVNTNVFHGFIFCVSLRICAEKPIICTSLDKIQVLYRGWFRSGHCWLLRMNWSTSGSGNGTRETSWDHTESKFNNERKNKRCTSVVSRAVNICLRQCVGVCCLHPCACGCVCIQYTLCVWGQVYTSYLSFCSFI